MQALAELIWNGLDADASEVVVPFDYNELDSLSEVIVRDNGMGIPRDRAPEYFRRLGGSWKRPGAATQGGRFLHGQEGRGRFKAFAIGDFAEWSVVYEKKGKPWAYEITMSAADKIDAELRLKWNSCCSAMKSNTFKRARSASHSRCGGPRRSRSS